LIFTIACFYVHDLRTNSNYFPVLHYQIGSNNRDGVCLLRGTDWIFNVVL
jgi:hypothetical protein